MGRVPLRGPAGPASQLDRLGRCLRRCPGELACSRRACAPGWTAKGIAGGLAVLLWIGGGIHAVAISGDATRRISIRHDPVVEAAQVRIDRRVEGKHLIATQPSIAREVGVGRPDVPGADDYGLIDVNHCPAGTLASLPGISSELALDIVDGREQAGGYSSVEDLGMLLNLPPSTVDVLRDLTVFTPI